MKLWCDSIFPLFLGQRYKRYVTFLQPIEYIWASAITVTLSGYIAIGACDMLCCTGERES
jgi:hypothetical protein